MAEAGERYAECTFVETDRFGGGSFMVWGGVCLRGRMELYVMAAGTLTAARHGCRDTYSCTSRLQGHLQLYVMAAGTLTAVRYRDEILDPIVRPIAGAIRNNFILMQENARPHTARS